MSRSIPYPLKSLLTPGSTTINIWRCTSARSTIPKAFGPSRPINSLTWSKRWDKVLDWDFTKGHIRWFDGGKLNVSQNCLDRHLATRGDQVAIIWEGDNPSEDKKITYKQLHQDVCKFANA
jgi:acetyl-CoA synthetase